MKTDNIEKSFAMEILHEVKLANKRQFVIIILLVVALACSVAFNIYLSNDTGSSIDTIDVKDANDINNTNFGIGE